MLPLRVALVWHLHQPIYYPAGEKTSILPWVRLHAVKDYIGMARLIREFPDLHCTVNITPCLLSQIDDFNHGSIDDLDWQLSCKPAQFLSLPERQHLIENFFRCNEHTMIRPYPNFEKLRRMAQGNQNNPRAFSEQNLRDLQVWFNLVWIHASVRAEDLFLKEIIRQGKQFNEEQKLQVLEIQKKLLRDIIPLYRSLRESGQVELTTTPFYHPILPLLIDSTEALRSNPTCVLPKQRVSLPDHARVHVHKAMQAHTDFFGVPPAGIWPAEGGCSKDSLQLIEDAEVSWVASDEMLLGKTLNLNLTRDRDGVPRDAKSLYQPYRLNTTNKHLQIVFRDHDLSDRIGFVYQYWPDSKAAVMDFIHRLRAIRNQIDPRKHAVCIILDGENAWESYPGEGIPFLRTLYRGLSEDKQLKSCTVSEFLKETPAEKTLTDLGSGSWINGNFDIWIGSEEKNRAWERIAETKMLLSKAEIEESCDPMLIAEASDWFWWYGDDHFTNQKMQFDYIFRSYLIAALEKQDIAVPEKFHTPICKPDEQLLQHLHHRKPEAFVHPIIDGRIRAYYDWLGAGTVVERSGFSAMHAVADQSQITKLYYGFSKEMFFLRLDLGQDLLNALAQQEKMVISVSLTTNHQSVWTGRFSRNPDGTLVHHNTNASQSDSDLAGGLIEIAELQCSLQEMGISSSQTCKLRIHLEIGGREMDYPAIGPVEIVIPHSFESEREIWP